MSDLIKTIVESMKRNPDKWSLLDDKSTGRINWARIEGDAKKIDVKLDGTIEVGQTNVNGKMVYCIVPVGFFGKRAMKAAVRGLLREKAMRIIDRSELENSETS